MSGGEHGADPSLYGDLPKQFDGQHPAWGFRLQTHGLGHELHGQSSLQPLQESCGVHHGRSGVRHPRRSGPGDHNGGMPRLLVREEGHQHHLRRPRGVHGAPLQAFDVLLDSGVPFQYVWLRIHVGSYRIGVHKARSRGYVRGAGRNHCEGYAREHLPGEHRGLDGVAHSLLHEHRTVCDVSYVHGLPSDGLLTRECHGPFHRVGMVPCGEGH